MNWQINVFFYLVVLCVVRLILYTYIYNNNYNYKKKKIKKIQH